MRRPLPAWAAAAVLLLFGGLAVLFLKDPIGDGAQLEAAEPLQPAYYDASPRRPVRREMSFDGMTCTTCHDPSEPLTGNPEKKGEFHEKIRLEHGRNTLCFNCHDRKNLGSFVDHGGGEIPMGEVEMLCAKCHGPKYRDWTEGAHGRRSGRWDLKKGRRTTLACIACHDPHSPVFKPMDAAPPPQVNPRPPHGGEAHAAAAQEHG